MFFLNLVFVKNNQLITDIPKKGVFWGGRLRSLSLCSHGPSRCRPSPLSPPLCPLVRSNRALFYIPVVAGWAAFRISQSLPDLTAALCRCVWCRAYTGPCCEGTKVPVWSWAKGVLVWSCVNGLCSLVQNWGPGDYLVDESIKEGWPAGLVRLAVSSEQA